jgi:hypothetical protein
VPDELGAVSVRQFIANEANEGVRRTTGGREPAEIRGNPTNLEMRRTVAWVTGMPAGVKAPAIM